MRQTLTILIFLFSLNCFGSNNSKVSPPDSDIILSNTIEFEKMGKTNEAIDVLTKGLVSIQKWNPTVENHSFTQVYYSEIPLYLKLGELYVQAGDRNEAIKALEKGVSRNSGSEELLEFYMNLLINNGSEQQAKDTLKRQCASYFLSNEICKNAL